MILKSKNSLIKYSSSESLNLMEPPPKDSENNLYSDYNNFINNVLSIYETQTINGNIPVFVTKAETNNANGKRYPDADSTLRELKPGRSYRINLISDNVLPMRIPNPIGLNEFLNDNDDQTNSSKICNKIFINSPYTDNKIILNSGILSSNINIPITGMQPNKDYSFSFNPVFSNWPAKITPQTGIIRRSGPLSNSYTSGTIEMIFSYYPYLLDNLDSIPYSINGDINRDYYTDNVHTILNLNIQDDKCSVYNDNYIIESSGSIPDHSQPTIIFGENTKSTDPQNFIHATVSGLNPNIDYSFNFKAINSNWPTNISPKSGIIKPKNINDGLSIIHAVLTFAKSLTDNNSNLDYILEPVLDDNNTISNKYIDLELIIEPLNNSKFNKISESKKITYVSPIYYDTYIKFRENSIPPVTYPLLGSSSDRRPRSEFSASSGCCQEAFNLIADISKARLGEKYTYTLFSYPQITLIPSSGTFGTDIDGTSSTIDILAYLDGQKNSSVYITLTHDDSQNSVSDSILLRCPQSTWTQ